jgi:hypothetical protein
MVQTVQEMKKKKLTGMKGTLNALDIKTLQILVKYGCQAHIEKYH